MKPTIIVVEATQEMIHHVVEPMIDNDCIQFILVSTQTLVSLSDQVVIRKEATIEDVVQTSMEYARSEQHAVLLKGQVHTSLLLKGVLKRENGLRTDKPLSQVTKVELSEGKRSFLLSDAALNIAPTIDMKIAIVKNAMGVAHKIGITQPKVAVLSSVEEVNPKMPSSVEADAVASYFMMHPEKAIVEGPISMDIAVDSESAIIKQYQGKIQGNADVLIVPNIDAGNILYKTFTHLMHCKISGILVGAAVPIALTSRSDSGDMKIASLKLALATID